MENKSGLYIHDSQKYPRMVENVSPGIRRMKVPNGWLVIVALPSGNSTNTVFLVDSGHTWDLEPEKNG